MIRRARLTLAVLHLWYVRYFWHDDIIPRERAIHDAELRVARLRGNL